MPTTPTDAPHDAALPPERVRLSPVKLKAKARGLKFDLLLVELLRSGVPVVWLANEAMVTEEDFEAFLRQKYRDAVNGVPEDVYLKRQRELLVEGLNVAMGVAKPKPPKNRGADK